MKQVCCYEIHIYILLRRPPMTLSRVWFLYISPFPLYHIPPHTLLFQYVSLCEGEDGESRSVPSRSEDARRRTGSSWAPALKTNCDKVSVCNESVEIGPGMLDYLLRSAPSYRERNYQGNHHRGKKESSEESSRIKTSYKTTVNWYSDSR